MAKLSQKRKGAPRLDWKVQTIKDIYKKENMNELGLNEDEHIWDWIKNLAKEREGIFKKKSKKKKKRREQEG